VDQSRIHALRQVVAALGNPSSMGSQGFVALGADGPDEALGAGLARGALHEIVAFSQADAPASAGFALGLCLRLSDGSGPGAGVPRQVLWLRERHGEAETGKLYPPGLGQMGLAPQWLVHIRVAEAKSLLQAGIEAASCAALAAVVIEPWGNPAVLDLTATRKLSLAAEASGTTVFLLRPSGRAGASVARTRWRVRAAPSRPLEANAPGHPVFDIELLRHRGGRDGLSWRVEWNSDRQCFSEEALLRPVVPAASDRPAQAPGGTSWRRAG
jgi:protein ImuA